MYNQLIEMPRVATNNRGLSSRYRGAQTTMIIAQEHDSDKTSKPLPTSTYCDYTFQAVRVGLIRIIGYPDNHNSTSLQYKEVLKVVQNAERDFTIIDDILHSIPANVRQLIPGMAKPLLLSVYRQTRFCLVQPWWDLNEIQSGLATSIQAIYNDASNVLFPKPVAIKGRKPPTNEGYVYLIKAPNGLYKIGYTSNPQDRMRTFENKLPFKVRYHCLIKTDEMRQLEKSLHQYFAQRLIDGEWFKLTAMDVQLMDGLATGKSFRAAKRESEKSIRTLPLFQFLKGK